jgi:hypothetical protein
MAKLLKKLWRNQNVAGDNLFCTEDSVDVDPMDYKEFDEVLNYFKN